MGRHSTFLSGEEHGVAAGALFYKVEESTHCVKDVPKNILSQDIERLLQISYRSEFLIHHR